MPIGEIRSHGPLAGANIRRPLLGPAFSKALTHSTTGFSFTGPSLAASVAVVEPFVGGGWSLPFKAHALLEPPLPAPAPQAALTPVPRSSLAAATPFSSPLSSSTTPASAPARDALSEVAVPISVLRTLGVASGTVVEAVACEPPCGASTAAAVPLSLSPYAHAALPPHGPASATETPALAAPEPASAGPCARVPVRLVAVGPPPVAHGATLAPSVAAAVVMDSDSAASVRLASSSAPLVPAAPWPLQLLPAGATEPVRVPLAASGASLLPSVPAPHTGGTGPMVAPPAAAAASADAASEVYVPPAVLAALGIVQASAPAPAPAEASPISRGNYIAFRRLRPSQSVAHAASGKDPLPTAASVTLALLCSPGPAAWLAPASRPSAAASGLAAAAAAGNPYLNGPGVISAAAAPAVGAAAPADAASVSSGNALAAAACSAPAAIDAGLAAVFGRPRLASVGSVFPIPLPRSLLRSRQAGAEDGKLWGLTVPASASAAAAATAAPPAGVLGADEEEEEEAAAWRTAGTALALARAPALACSPSTPALSASDSAADAITATPWQPLLPSLRAPSSPLALVAGVDAPAPAALVPAQAAAPFRAAGATEAAAAAAAAATACAAVNEMAVAKFAATKAGHGAAGGAAKDGKRQQQRVVTEWIPASSQLPEVVYAVVVSASPPSLASDPFLIAAGSHADGLPANGTHATEVLLSSCLAYGPAPHSAAAFIAAPGARGLAAAAAQLARVWVSGQTARVTLSLPVPLSPWQHLPPSTARAVSSILAATAPLLHPLCPRARLYALRSLPLLVGGRGAGKRRAVAAAAAALGASYVELSAWDVAARALGDLRAARARIGGAGARGGAGAGGAAGAGAGEGADEGGGIEALAASTAIGCSLTKALASAVLAASAPAQAAWPVSPAVASASPRAVAAPTIIHLRHAVSALASYAAAASAPAAPARALRALSAALAHSRAAPPLAAAVVVSDTPQALAASTEGDGAGSGGGGSEGGVRGAATTVVEISVPDAGERRWAATAAAGARAAALISAAAGVETGTLSCSGIPGASALAKLPPPASAAALAAAAAALAAARVSAANGEGLGRSPLDEAAAAAAARGAGATGGDLAAVAVEGVDAAWAEMLAAAAAAAAESAVGVAAADEEAKSVEAGQAEGEDDWWRGCPPRAALACAPSAAASDVFAAASAALSPAATAAMLTRAMGKGAEALQQRLMRDSGGAAAVAKVPEVRWADVGGMEDVKREVADLIAVPDPAAAAVSAAAPVGSPPAASSSSSLRPSAAGAASGAASAARARALAASLGRTRSGLLLYGPPGTGKTLVAKAIATEAGLNFMAVKGPELLNMYIGESEKNVREVFRRAREAAPCVLFFDELDSLAPARGQGNDAGGVLDRVVSQLLAELDTLGGSPEESARDTTPDASAAALSAGAAIDPWDVTAAGAAAAAVSAPGGKAPVFVVGATNRPDLLDSSLLRPGRLDRCVYLGVATDKAAQAKVLGALTRKFTLEPGFTMDDVVATCPLTFTGADMYALASDAALIAAKRTAALLGEAHRAQCASGKSVSLADYLAAQPASAVAVRVSRDDFAAAAAALTPSLSADELDHYAQLQESFRASHGKRA